MKKDIKKAIIDATIKLINEKGGNPDDITVRDICKEAGVSVSLINYHFQTKENLIAHCVQSIIGSITLTHEPWTDAFPGKSLRETLKIALTTTLTFMYAAENISRISILTDHQDPHQGDNTHQTMDAFYPLIKKLCAKKDIDDPKKINMLLVQSIQGAFLRTDLIKEDLGIDLRDADERKKFVDDYIDVLFK
jgi:AcrR family transcriptional regulator